MAFVFGSFLRSAHPKDLDLLVIYDPSQCPPNIAYRAHAPISARLGEKMGVPVDMTLLTYREEQSSRFIAESGALPIVEALLVDLPRKISCPWPWSVPRSSLQNFETNQRLWGAC